MGIVAVVPDTVQTNVVAEAKASIRPEAVRGRQGAVAMRRTRQSGLLFTWKPARRTVFSLQTGAASLTRGDPSIIFIGMLPLPRSKKSARRSLPLFCSLLPTPYNVD